jgi:hypothetical protein
MGAPQVTIETITVTRPLKVQYNIWATKENILYRTQYITLCVLKLPANVRSDNAIPSCHLTLSLIMGGGVLWRSEAEFLKVFLLAIHIHLY